MVDQHGAVPLGPLGQPEPAPHNGVRFIVCAWCGAAHSPQFLCEPAALRLAQLHAASAAGGAEVPDGMTAQVLGDGDRTLRTFVVNAATTEVLGIPRATLILTGADINGHTLPRWVVIDEDATVLALAVMVAERAQAAVAGARSARGEPADGP